METFFLLIFQVVSDVAAALRSLQVSQEEVAGAKKALLADAYEILLENQMARAEDIGLQALLRKEINSPSNVSALVEGVTVSDVQVRRLVHEFKADEICRINLANRHYSYLAYSTKKRMKYS